MPHPAPPQPVQSQQSAAEIHARKVRRSQMLRLKSAFADLERVKPAEERRHNRDTAPHAEGSPGPSSHPPQQHRGQKKRSKRASSRDAKRQQPNVVQEASSTVSSTEQLKQLLATIASESRPQLNFSVLTRELQLKKDPVLVSSVRTLDLTEDKESCNDWDEDPVRVYRASSHSMSSLAGSAKVI
ncbi:Hypothetical predicted protein [Cloeon dipterum]|uniref:Uncharacterized protein n=1 Tax=Cloeon dipterum TaxID=197152 RepID=A0A8S1DYI4_9INSE|nr:Hypothetical predicted protein [Cloeon dipterum]